ncbi:MAG: GTPase ObgE, partial [Microlunatus sp.]|nr:GTPase ObgE [Microlunatus sp.]
IGGEDAVIFDFSPQVDIGAEILGRRGEDQRLVSDRPAAQRRKAKDEEYHRAMEAGELQPYQMPTGTDDDPDEDQRG